MSTKTGIEWTDATWNPVRGCSRVSEGCRNCYAELVAARFSGPGQPYEGLARRRSNGEPQWTGEVRLIEKHLTDPLRWTKPRRVFVNSMSDLFHEKLPREAIAQVFAVMALAQQHVFQVLTKRPDRMRELVSDDSFRVDAGLAAIKIGHQRRMREFTIPDWPLPNVWLGVSVEDQRAADERIPLLCETPAAVRFLSCEPLLGPLDITAWIEGCAVPEGPENGYRCDDYPGIDWVIVGGESGPGARPCKLYWIRDLVAQCGFAGVACFVKQLGSKPEVRNDEDDERWPGATVPLAESYESQYQGEPAPLALHSRKGGDMSEWPEDLRVREFPEVRA